VGVQTCLRWAVDQMHVERRRCASKPPRKSWQHMGLSVTLCAAILGWYASRGASTSAVVAVIGIGAFLVIYNIVRITRARDALREPARLLRVAPPDRRVGGVDRGHSHLVHRLGLVVPDGSAPGVTRHFAVGCDIREPA
jgi:hypothetical protein